MKLSTREELLNSADKLLSEIRTNIKKKKVNELDWDAHRRAVQMQRKDIEFGADSHAERLRMIGMKQLEKKYSSLPPNSYTPEQMQAEVDQLLKEIQRLRKHLTQRRTEIPKNPKKQTELQKVLVNHPIVTPEEFEKDPGSALYQDPITGLYWFINAGVAGVPPELLKVSEEEMEEHMKNNPDSGIFAGIPEWDKSRGFLWNIFRLIHHLSVPGYGN